MVAFSMRRKSGTGLESSQWLAMRAPWPCPRHRLARGRAGSTVGAHQSRHAGWHRAQARL